LYEIADEWQKRLKNRNAGHVLLQLVPRPCTLTVLMAAIRGWSKSTNPNSASTPNGHIEKQYTSQPLRNCRFRNAVLSHPI